MALQSDGFQDIPSFEDNRARRDREERQWPRQAAEDAAHFKVEADNEDEASAR